MNAKTKKGILALIVAAAVCLASAAGYFIGRSAGQKELRRERESLISLNRAGIENMSVPQSSGSLSW